MSMTIRECPKRRAPAAPQAPQVEGDTQVSINQDPAPRLPHERDESADSQESEPRPRIVQAKKDLDRGLVDTDRGPPADEAYKKQKGG